MTRIMVGVVALALALVVFQPADGKTKWEGGLKGGFTWSTLDGADVGTTDTRTTLSFGGFAERHIRSQFGVRLEALWMQMGGQTNVLASEAFPDDAIPSNPDVIYTLELSYFDFPLVAYWNLPAFDEDNGAIELFAGPVIGFNINATVLEQVSSSERSASVRSSVNNVDFAGTVGAAVAWDHNYGRFGLEGRFRFSLSTIVDGKDVKNNSFMLFLRYGWPWGGESGN